MGAQIYTDKEVAIFRLRPLPDIPFIGAAESQRLRKVYEDYRRGYRTDNPIKDNVEPGDPGYASTRESKTLRCEPEG